MKLTPCSRCAPQAHTRADCPECRGFGEYWSGRPDYGVRPTDADGDTDFDVNGKLIKKHRTRLPLDGAAMAAFYEQGLSTRQIGRKFGVCATTAAARIREHTVLGGPGGRGRKRR